MAEPPTKAGPRPAGRLLAALLAASLPPARAGAAATEAATGAAASALPDIWSVVAALALVIGLIVLAGRLARHGLVRGAGQQHLQVVAGIAVGGRERIVLVRAGGRELLVGVAPGQVRLLCTLPGSGDDPNGAAGTAPGTFARVLAAHEASDPPPVRS